MWYTIYLFLSSFSTFSPRCVFLLLGLYCVQTEVFHTFYHLKLKFDNIPITFLFPIFTKYTRYHDAAALRLEAGHVYLRPKTDILTFVSERRNRHVFCHCSGSFCVFCRHLCGCGSDVLSSDPPSGKINCTKFRTQILSIFIIFLLTFFFLQRILLSMTKTLCTCAQRLFLLILTAVRNE